jgi:S1-C subfamily serine protease
LGHTDIPVATQTLLNGVRSPESKSIIKSVLMLWCPKSHMKGTGFVIGDGALVTTNSHVVGNCSADELVGVSSVSKERVTFTHLERDENRDLALLCAPKPLPFSLQLSSDGAADVETEVETWGYPLRY